ncbi:MAG TPA: bifunctional phosphoribosylaminoimidazolecarboxamide formyltransferase/IMP cyclohydrolase [Myxococcales bacterium]|nr:bifunctional phosphoribosylaminoimidazolecarboxamide formyltransferase/IMP cyclohydrolase [Myxococcales bacterium]
MTVARALISVSDKSGLLDFARGLAALGIEILSTGGTAALLAKEGVKVTQVQDFTGAPEMLGGRVKTLHPKVHGGILARRKLPSDQADMERQGVKPIDLVVVNLYPFRAAVAKGLPDEEVVENIDIGGPSMLRSAAKNAEYVTVIVDPADYGVVLAELQQRREVHESTRHRLQARAFAHTAAYDAAIAGWLAERQATAHPEEGGGFAESPPLPEYRRRQSLRYGENPHQRAAFYASVPQPAEPTLASARQLQGKELSYNNLLDGSAALEALKEHASGRSGQAAVVVVKHTNPCGVARAQTILEAYKLARDADPVSAFGGIVALSHPVDAATGAALAETFLEAVIAPGFEPGALDLLKAKKSLRLLEVPLLGEGRETWTPEAREVRSLPGGLLVQSRDLADADPRGWQQVSRRAPTPDELEALSFGWSVVKHVKSNAIVFARREVTVGIGMGQTNRVDSVRIAAQRAGEKARGAVMASDAFFPFPDGVEEGARAGITAIAQPGGSVRDDEVIAAADRLGLAMVFTGVRHFRH